MIDQLEVANIIVLNKTDLVSKKNLKIVLANLKALSPEA
jgi:G3E family GTPase